MQHSDLRLHCWPQATALAERMQQFADRLEEALGQAPSHPVNAVTQVLTCLAAVF